MGKGNLNRGKHGKSARRRGGEEKRAEKSREKANRKIEELQRRMAQSVPYEKVMLSSERERLRREVRELRSTFLLPERRRKLMPGEASLLEGALSSVEQLQVQL